jgi:hypothetical protein
VLKVDPALPKDGSVLYKYRDLIGKGLERVKDILSESRVYLSSARDFNDPFDMKIHYELRSTEKEMHSYFDDLLKRRVGLGRSQHRIEVQRLINEYRQPKKMDELASKMQQRVYDKLGVLSLSEDPSHILMWSHYAASHTGICIGFDYRDSLFTQALKVGYQDDYYVIDAIAKEGDEARRVLTTKATFWAYERERRVIDTKGPGLRRFDPKAICMIILGSRISTENANMVTQWARAHGQGVRILRARESNASFALEFDMQEEV